MFMVFIALKHKCLNNERSTTLNVFINVLKFCSLTTVHIDKLLIVIIIINIINFVACLLYVMVMVSHYPAAYTIVF